MDDLERDLQRVLTARVDDVRPQLTGATIQEAAARRRARHSHVYAPLAAAAVVLAIAVLSVVLLGHDGRKAQPAGPANSSTTSDTSAPAPPTRSAPRNPVTRTSAPIPTSSAVTTANGAPALPSASLPAKAPTGMPAKTPTGIPAVTTAIPGALGDACNGSAPCRVQVTSSTDPARGASR